MAIRLEDLGGTPWADGNILDAADLTDTILAGGLSFAPISAEQAYKTLAASLSYINGYSTAAEDFTSAGGANGTGNIGSTTASFDTDKYQLSLSATPTNEEFMNSQSFTDSNNDLYGHKITPNKTIYLFNIDFWGPFTGNLCVLKNSSGTTIATRPISSNTCSFGGIQLNSGQDYFIISGTNVTTITHYGDQTGIVLNRTDFDIDNTSYRFDSESDTSPSSLTTGAYINISDIGISTSISFNTNSEVVCDTNTLAVDNETNAFALHWQGNFPTDTSGSFDLTSGGDTINLPVNSTTKKTAVTPKGALTNISNMIIRAKLETTDTNVTPTINGWGITKL